MFFLNKLTDLFTDKLWSIDVQGSSPIYARAVRFMKLLRTTVHTFTENRMGFQCVSLSYFVTLAVVPFIALLFLVTGGLGLSDKLTEMLFKAFPTNPDLVRVALEKAEILLDGAMGGGVGLLSGLLFLWAILWMMFQIERVFNNVWGILRIPRKIYKRFGFYLLVLGLSPFIILLFGTGIAFYTNLTNLIGIDLSDLRFLPKFLGYIGFYIIAVFIMSAMYKFIPSAKVSYKYALKSAVVSAFVFVVFQYIYLETQMFMGRLNRVYGVVAAFPLFLIWLNFSWQIIIYGAELTYSFQKIDHYDEQ